MRALGAARQRLRRPTAVGVLAGFALLVCAGCADDRCEGAMADAIYVRVVDATTGEPIMATVSAMIGTDEVDVACSLEREEDDLCEVWAVGLLLAGRFDVTVESEGYAPFSETVEVLPGDCGPMSVMRRYELFPVP